ncbi:hypothetical protein IV38_GL002023 [Lactobacillus selangorensis]|uniref:HTH araC/xylS-type domain-containing protein n=1 Tax=Lactobacillus selangorensis TaxID=81857 RepID=A0A0R2FGD3_9LACO|nr:AraC family transcriptional regulator [Lactobacillus selangorensis]KRN27568.1 hypothetical protein IV38_GL002023 [Lactobacillus selangorensis]KRN30159.1 hypothetical protein IV40_GL002005 [Lactobacillus selangorensis]
MKDQRMQRMESNLSGGVPVLSIEGPLALFYKRRDGERLLYTKIQDGQITTFEGKDYAPEHRHDFFELMLVLEGSIINHVGNRTIRYQHGEGCLMNRQVKHREEIQDHSQIVFVDFTADFFNSLLQHDATEKLTGDVFQFLKSSLNQQENWQHRYLEFSRSLPIENKTLQVILDSLQLECSTAKVGARFFQSGLVLRLLATLQNPNAFSVNWVAMNLSKDDYLVNQVRRLIEVHFGVVTRDEIAQEVHYNAEYLNRLFKQKEQKTLLEYARVVRIKKAQQLLSLTDLSVGEIADRLKFASAEYFYRYFRHATGVSPSRYRKKHQNYAD